MEISMHADYGFRVMMYLSQSSKKLVQIGTISAAYGISENHVTKVVQRLSKHGYVHAIRGRNGGIRLAQSPEQINLGRVFREMEPSLRILECFDAEANTCPIVKSCSLNRLFAQALRAFLEVLDKTTLATVLQNPQGLAKTLAIASK